jgi:hypothetical protein
LLLAERRRADEAVPLNEPGRVVDLAERQQSQAQFLDRLEVAHPQQVFLERPDEPFSAAVTLGRTPRREEDSGIVDGLEPVRIDMPRLVEHYLKGRLHLDDWISARIKLPEINDGFANMKAGKVLRSVIMFDA